MPTASEIATTLTTRAATRATDAVGFQVSKAVDMAVNGLLNAIMGESTDDRRKEMNEHHDRLLEIVQKTPVAPSRHQFVSPREKIERDVRDSNEHIRAAMDELKQARSLTKCSVCKGTLDATIDIVGEATNEILDTSEKVLAIQKLKDVGEIAPEQTWDTINRKQKDLVLELVQQYHPLKPGAIFEHNDNEEGEVPDVRKVKTRKPAAKRRKSAGRRSKK